MASVISTKTSGGGGIAVTGDTSGVLQLASNDGTTAVTIDASQNVGIGTASPAYKLHSTGTIGSGTTGTNGSYAFKRASDGVELATISVDTTTLIYNSGLGTHIWQGGGTERMRIDASGNLLFNSGYGSVATAYGCRAWVNFNGTGTVAIRASGGVSSITDHGTGAYTANLSITLPDTNYEFNLSIGGAGSSNSSNSVVQAADWITAPTTTSIRVQTSFGSNGVAWDAARVCISIFR